MLVERTGVFGIIRRSCTLARPRKRLILAVAMASSYSPARRAARLDPMAALRCESRKARISTCQLSRSMIQHSAQAFQTDSVPTVYRLRLIQKERTLLPILKEELRQPEIK